MKRIRGVVAVLALSVVLVAPRQAEAQVQLGWNSSLAVVCLNLACTNIQFTLSLSGFKPTDNNGQPVPAGITGLNSPGYPTFFRIDINGGPGTFTGVPVVVNTGWIAGITNGFLTVAAAQLFSPYGPAPIVVNTSLTAGIGSYNFGYSGLAYLGNTGQCYTSAGALDLTCAQTSYKQGDFNGSLSTNTVPEPMSMTLLGTGLLGLGLVGIRRRKNSKK